MGKLFSNIVSQIDYSQNDDYSFSHHREKKIVLRGDNTQHLHDLIAKAKEKGLESYLVSDAGLTQIAPGSNTVLSVFGRDEIVNQVTGKLKLL